MADQWNGGQTGPQWSGGQYGPGERWNVNLPAVIGVVFVFLVGVIVWVIVASGDDDGQITTGTLASTVAPSTSSPIPQTTTPPPMPSTTVIVVPTAPAPPLTSAPVVVPATAAPTAPPATDAPPPPPEPAPTDAPSPTPTNPPTTVAPQPPPPGGGDLGVPGHPMQHPPCDGGYITILASAIGDQATADSMESVLDDHTGSSYLRTDVTCSSLTPSDDGKPIYVVYFGPFATSSEACSARSQGPDDAYVRRLSNELGPGHSVTC